MTDQTQTIDSFLPRKWRDNGDGTYAPEVAASVGDIQLGSVEIKDGSTDNRANVNAAGALLVRETQPTVGTLSSVLAAVVSTTILASNAIRRGATVYNDSTAVLYLAYSASTASSTAYSVQVAAGGYVEIPYVSGGVYTGQLTGIWAAANGNARVTELT